jgi:hypothetical protein
MKTATQIIRVTGKDFGYAVKFLKKNGFTFNAATKVWSGTSDVSFLTDNGYAVAIQPAAVVDNRMNMDHADSIL